MKTKVFRIGAALSLATLVLALPTQAALHKRAIVIQTQDFQVAANARILVGDNHAASLNDLRLGDRVTVAYDRENGVLVAHRIADGVIPHPHNPNATPKPKNHPPQARPTLAHVRGILQAVDVQAGTLTITDTPHHRRL